MTSTRKSGLQLLAIVLLALALRLALLIFVLQIGPPRWTSDDTPGYIRPAQAMLALHTFSQDVQHPAAPELLRTPGYPLFLAAIGRFTGDWGLWPILFQNLLWCLTIPPLTWLVGRRLVNPRTGFFAALLTALDPCSILVGQLLLSETLFTVCLIGSIAAAALWFHLRTLPRAFLSGLLLGCAALVRPIALYLVLVYIIAFVWHVYSAGKGQRARAFISALAFALPWLLLVGGWCARNYHQAGRADLGVVTDVTLLYTRAAGVEALARGKSSIAAYRKVRNEFKKNYPFYTGVSADERALAYTRAPQYRELAWSILRQHPWRTAQLQLLCMGRFFLDTNGEIFRALTRGVHPPKPPGVRKLKPPKNHAGPALQLLAALHLALVYALAGYMLWRLLRTFWRTRAFSVLDFFFLAAIIYFAAASAIPEVNARFRVPVMPILCLYAGEACFVLLTRGRPGSDTDYHPS